VTCVRSAAFTRYRKHIQPKLDNNLHHQNTPDQSCPLLARVSLLGADG
jgi:hypothetical protein